MWMNRANAARPSNEDRNGIESSKCKHMETAENIDLYEQLFSEMLDTCSSEMISNDSDKHAIVLIKQLILHAEHEVKVVCQALTPDVWAQKDVLSAIQTALGNYVKFTFITFNTVENEELLSVLKDSHDVRILRYRFATPNANFVLVDDCAFRFEPDPSVRKGFAFASAPEEAKLLKEGFDEMLASSDEVDWRH